MNAHRFHEWPLVAFTTLAIMGASLLTAPLVAAIAGGAAGSAAGLLSLGTATLAAGVLVSLAHLGQPQRAPLALARAGRSRLSNEIVLASATLASGLLAALFPQPPLAPLLASACAVAFLLSLGFVYALRGQPTWQGIAAVSPLVLGLGFATVALAGFSSWRPASAGPGAGAVAAVAPVALVLLATDVGVFLFRKAGGLRHAARAWRHTVGGHAAGAWRQTAGAPRQDVAVSRIGLHAVRFLLVDILPVCLVLAGLPKGAAGVLGLGILLDRLAFYLLAVQHTTEAEIARVEAVIAGGGEAR